MAKREKTAEEIADDNDRTNSMGLFNTAEAYWMSAVALKAAKVKAGQPASRFGSSITTRSNST